MNIKWASNKTLLFELFSFLIDNIGLNRIN